MNTTPLHLLRTTCSLFKKNDISNDDLSLMANVLTALSTPDENYAIHLREEIFEKGFSKAEWMNFAMDLDKISLLREWKGSFPWLEQIQNSPIESFQIVEKLVKLDSKKWIQFALENGLPPTTFITQKALYSEPVSYSILSFAVSLSANNIIKELSVFENSYLKSFSLFDNVTC